MAGTERQPETASTSMHPAGAGVADASASMHITVPGRGGRAAIVLLVLLAVAPLFAEAAGASYLVSLTTRIAIWGLAAASLQLLIGGAGLPSLGHGAFVGIGAYAVGVAFHHAQGMDGALGFLETRLPDQDPPLPFEFQPKEKRTAWSVDRRAGSVQSAFRHHDTQHDS